MQQENNLAVTIDPAKTALLLLHWQNEIAMPKGKRSSHVQERLAAAHTIEHTQAVLKATREKEMLVVFVNICHRPGYPERSAKSFQLSGNYARLGAWVMGTWGVENIDQLKPLDDEIIIHNYSTSAFCYTELDLILRNKGITDLVLSGLVTNWVVESTARDGANRGYFIYILKDCCNSFNDEMHNWPLTYIFPRLGIILDSEAYIAALQG